MRSSVSLSASDTVSQSVPATTGDRDLLTLPTAAERLSISKRTLERLIASGAFPHPVKIGRSSRVPRGDITRYLEQLCRERGDKIGAS